MSIQGIIVVVVGLGILFGIGRALSNAWKDRSGGSSGSGGPSSGPSGRSPQ